jgi:hypothetical protein
MSQVKISSSDLELPLLSGGFIKWINEQDFTDKTLLEIGSGHSTLFFSDHFNRVNSFENDTTWYNKILNRIKERSISNVSLNLMNVNILKDEFFLDLVKISDVFLVDNNPNFLSRFGFVQLIHQNKKAGSVIVFDNGDWNKESYEFLRANYYCLDFLRTEHGRLTQTSVFFEERDGGKRNRVKRNKLI